MFHHKWCFRTRSTVQCTGTRHSAVECSIEHSVVECSIEHSAVECSTEQYSTAQYKRSIVVASAQPQSNLPWLEVQQMAGANGRRAAGQLTLSPNRRSGPADSHSAVKHSVAPLPVIFVVSMFVASINCQYTAVTNYHSQLT